MCRKRKRDTYGTIEYFKRTRWKEIKRRTINNFASNRLHRPQNISYARKQIKLEMSVQEFNNFCDENKNIILKYYRLGQTPSVDRIDSNGPYKIGNIRIIELKENLRGY